MKNIIVSEVFLLFIILILLNCTIPMPNYNVSSPIDKREKITYPDNFEEMLFPEKRRTRFIGFKKEDGHYNFNDFDRDGITNKEDPFPLDYSYPGVRFNELDLPLLTIESSIYTNLDFHSFTNNSNFNLGTFSLDLNDFPLIEDFPRSLQCLSDYWYLRDHFNHYWDTDEIYTNLITNELQINLVSIDNKFEYHPCVNKYNYYDRDYNQTWSYGSNLSEKFVAKSGNLVEKLNEFQYMEYNNMEVFAKSIYRIITGTDGTLESVANLFIRAPDVETHIHIPPELLKNIAYSWGLPDNWSSVPWQYLSYDSFIFSTLKCEELYDDVRITGLDNKILYHRNLDYDWNVSGDDFDAKYKVKFNNSSMDFENMIAVKVIITREDVIAGSDYSLKLFISGKRPKIFAEQVRQYMASHYGVDANVYLLDLDEAGFSYDTYLNEIVYDARDDSGRFWEYFYYIYGKAEYKKQLEIYTLFFFFMPYKGDNEKWAVFGSTVHFWPIQERNTVVAKLDKDNNVLEGPFVLPPEYLCNPQEYINDDYIRNLYNSVDGLLPINFNSNSFNSLFHIDATKGEKILFMQGIVKGGVEHAPSVNTKSVICFYEDEGKIFPIKSSNIQLIYSSNNPIPTNSEQGMVIQRFLSDLYSRGYIICFEDVTNLVYEPCVIQMVQNYYYYTSSSFKISVTGIQPPSAPINFNAEETGSESVDLSWEIGSENTNGYRLERKDPGEDYHLIADFGPATTQYTDTDDLLSGTTYDYRLCAYNQAGDSEFATASATTIQTPPAAPTQLSLFNVTDRKVVLNWIDNSHNEEIFKIERKLESEPDNAYIQIATVGPNIHTYSDEGLTVGTSYNYRVKASNSAGESAYTNVITATTLAQLPDTPMNLQATVNSFSQITLTWNDVEHEDSYEIWRRTATETFFTFIGTTQQNVTNYVNSGLTANSTYQYQVRACNTNGCSEYSNTVTATTAAQELPDGVTGLTCDLTFQDTVHGSDDHWVPNTCERSRPFTITIKGRDNANNPINLPNGFNIKLLTPADPNWDTNDVGLCNINRNKGEGHFWLCATNQDGTSEYELILFRRNANAQNFLLVRYNELYFNVDTGKARDEQGYYLRVNDQGELVFVDNGMEYVYFSVKAVENTGTIRPGDDMLLRFTLADFEGQISAAQAVEGDFLAVYDKKMLWRANLYIDEGANDWNNDPFNRWNSNENEWNKVYNGQNRLPSIAHLMAGQQPENPNPALYANVNVPNNAVLYTINSGELADGDGGQVVTIVPFTVIPEYGGNRVEDDVVAYSYGCSDSPFEYNNDMWQQRQFIGTTAPGNYDPDYRYPNEENNDLVDEENRSDNDTRNNEEYVQHVMDYLAAHNNFPYLPGWALEKYYMRGEFIPSDWENIISAGVDCVGLVQMSASYNGNSYIWDDISDHARGDISCQDIYLPWLWYLGSVGRGYPVHGGYQDIGGVRRPNEGGDSWYITDEFYRNEGIILNLDKVVPGDVIYYPMNPANGQYEHIIIVLDVSYDNEESRATQPNRILLIESTFGQDDNFIDFHKIIDTRYLNRYLNTNWVIIRLNKNN